MNPLYSVSFIIITILITFLILRRYDTKSGCITYGYVGLIVFCINIFFIFSLLFFKNSFKETYQVITSGKNYTATIINYTNKETSDSNTMLTPIVRFNTINNKIIERELDFSTSEVKIGDTYKINYNQKNDVIITLGFPFFIKLIASFIFFFIFTFLFIGEIIYALNGEMKGYYLNLKKIGLSFFLPFLMIVFNSLMIYGVFHVNREGIDIISSLLLLFFISILTLGIVMYLKILFKKGISGLE